MDILTAVKRKLSPMTPGELEKFAQKSGVSFHTLRKIKTLETPNPRILTVQAILRAMKNK
jgi:DNA-binding phage protein